MPVLQVGQAENRRELKRKLHEEKRKRSNALRKARFKAGKKAKL